ncbi:hypothetical protein K4F52_001727 [Lecanicillium sp. MT-2017a]|nr:hypothetical protein K4F52_001727 [Lecanicillium sp. MT-2017a]
MSFSSKRTPSPLSTSEEGAQTSFEACGRRGCRRPEAGSFYPRLAPNRPLYILARAVGVIIALALVALAAVTLTVLPKGRDDWAAPVLSPALCTFCWSSREIWRIYKFDIRSHHLYRLLCDAALGFGYAIAFGYLVSFTRHDISRSDPTSTGTSAGVAVAILIMMLTEL